MTRIVYVQKKTMVDLIFVCPDISFGKKESEIIVTEKISNDAQNVFFFVEHKVGIFV